MNVVREKGTAKDMITDLCECECHNYVDDDFSLRWCFCPLRADLILPQFSIRWVSTSVV